MTTDNQELPPDALDQGEDICQHGVSYDDWCDSCGAEINAELAGIADDIGLGPLW